MIQIIPRLKSCPDPYQAGWRKQLVNDSSQPLQLKPTPLCWINTYSLNQDPWPKLTHY